MTARRTASSLWLLLGIAGFIVWSSAFVALYALQGLGCALRWDALQTLGTNRLTLMLGALWLLHLALLAALGWFSLRRWRPRPQQFQSVDNFLAAMTCLCVASALVATVYIGVPILFFPPCG